MRLEVFVPAGYVPGSVEFSCDLGHTGSRDHLRVVTSFEGGRVRHNKVYSLLDGTVAAYRPREKVPRIERFHEIELTFRKLEPVVPVTAMRLTRRQYEQARRAALALAKRRPSKDQAVAFLGDHCSEKRVREDVDSFETTLTWHYLLSDDPDTWMFLSSTHLDDEAIAGFGSGGGSISSGWVAVPPIAEIIDVPADYPPFLEKAATTGP